MNPSPFALRRFIAVLTLLFSLFAGLDAAWAVVADAGHRPFSSDVPFANGTATPRRQFREPYVEIGNDSTVTVYSVVKKFNNGFGISNQSGGALLVKGAGQVVWAAIGLVFHANEGDFQYWKASFTPSALGIGGSEVIQYCFVLNFSTADGGAVVEPTYLYAPSGLGDLASQTTNSEATAKASPFTIRNRPAWIFHANNRVTSGNQVQFWAKVGYIGDPNNSATQWATNGAVYYTTDGSTPAGQTGAPQGTSQAITFSYSHPESNNQGAQSIAGTPMWWVATAPTLLQAAPLGATIKYRIGFWNAANSEEKFAEHNAGTNNTVFSFTNGTVGDPVLTVNGVNGNYTTTKLFVDEVAGSSEAVTVTFAPGQANVTEVEIYTNLNRRDRAGLDANGDGYEDGIQPVDGNTIAAGDDNHYYAAWPMAGPVSGVYARTFSATKAGAYRLTARWKVAGDPNWRWYTNGGAGRRDHAITVTPVDARNINLYEMNVLNVESSDTTAGDSGDDFASRSTLEDLYDAPNAPHNFPGGGSRWNLDYLKNLGCNWLWFQPIHPIGDEGQSYDPGSPYAVKNFFEINELMSVNYSGSNTLAQNRSAALAAFAGFVAAADLAGVGVMLDAPFNHSAPDAELATQGVQIFAPAGNPGGWQAGDQIRNREARVFSASGNYGARAAGAGNIAVAPDRGDFGKWGDVRDVFFGNYSALVALNPLDNGNHLNESDVFDYTSTNWTSDDNTADPGVQNVTRGVWKYFAEYTLHWLAQTGVPAGSNLATQTAHGIDGLRADFGQGLPPQFWEYVINKTRARKWNFVFMAESLDGGAVTYRSNRHFDVLNENIVFPLASAGSASDYRSIFESRRSAYGQGLVLLNTTSHDEENYVDPFQALVRYAVVNTVDGIPLIFAGQELGISRTFGFLHYETNFGKQIAHFKRYNSMMPAWNDGNYGNDQLYPVYAGIGQARLFSKALRSSNRFFLDQTGGGGTHPQIFAVAKYETKNASPGVSDVVFAFANTDRDNNHAGNFNVSQDTDANSVNDYGIKADRLYNVRNIAAYTALNSNRRNIWQWRVNPADENSPPQPRSGADILTNGIFVGMNEVPISNGAWATAPYEAQYLKLYDVTPPPAAGTPGTPKAYAIGTAVTFSWSAASDPEGGISGYELTITGAGAPQVIPLGNVTSYAFTGSLGQTVQASVRAINNAGIAGTASPIGSGTILLSAAGDQDGDGAANASEDVAGTSPLDGSSVLRVTQIDRPAANSVEITWSSVPGVQYEVLATTDLSQPFANISGPLPITAANSSTTFTDVSAAPPRRFYLVRVLAP